MFPHTLNFHTNPFHVITCSADEFLIGMALLGKDHAMSLVAAFADDPDDPDVRTAHRDTPLPLHRDGVYTEAIAKMQGGNYIERPNTDVVGMYCLRDNNAPCFTTLSYDGEHVTHKVALCQGEALLWDNRLWHGREGAVGKRMLIRFWTTLDDRSILPKQVAAMTMQAPA